MYIGATTVTFLFPQGCLCGEIRLYFGISQRKAIYNAKKNSHSCANPHP